MNLITPKFKLLQAPCTCPEFHDEGETQSNEQVLPQQNNEKRQGIQDSLVPSDSWRWIIANANDDWSVHCLPHCVLNSSIQSARQNATAFLNLLILFILYYLYLYLYYLYLYLYYIIYIYIRWLFYLNLIGKSWKLKSTLIEGTQCHADNEQFDTLFIRRTFDFLWIALVLAPWQHSGGCIEARGEETMKINQRKAGRKLQFGRYLHFCWSRESAL